MHKIALVAQYYLWGERASCPLRTIGKLLLVLILAIFIIAARSTKASSGAELVVSISDQALLLLDGENLLARYRISTSNSAMAI